MPTFKYRLNMLCSLKMMLKINDLKVVINTYWNVCKSLLRNSLNKFPFELHCDKLFVPHKMKIFLGLKFFTAFISCKM